MRLNLYLLNQPRFRSVVNDDNRKITSAPAAWLNVKEVYASSRRLFLTQFALSSNGSSQSAWYLPSPKANTSLVSLPPLCHSIASHLPIQFSDLEVAS